MLLMICRMDAFAYKERKDYFSKPQIGGWFGPVTPLAETGKWVDTNLGGGLFVRFTLPYQFLKIGVDSSYQQFKSKGVNELKFVPLYANVLFQLPVDFPRALPVQGRRGAPDTLT